MIRSYLTFIILFIISNNMNCQIIEMEDSLLLKKNLTEIKLNNSKYNKAPILSSILPGLGQIHNKQYWKLPVIYGGYLLIGHYINFNNKMYKEFKDALIYEIDDDELTINPFPNFTESSLERNMEYWRRNRDLLIIFTGVYYLLNIVDAHVFSHLNNFDIGDNISANLSPNISRLGSSNVYGLGIKLNF